MKCRITEIIDEAKDIRSFRIEKRVSVTYLPGQWVYLKIGNGLKHQFTLSSSPTEKYLQITTKYREMSEYKKMLWKIQVGDWVEIIGPFGNFCLNKNDSSTKLFVAGGIGITPFRSMIKFVLDTNTREHIDLIYSVRNHLEGAFIDELRSINNNSINIEIVETSVSNRVGKDKLREYSEDNDRSIWICGPGKMVENIYVMAKELGFNSIKTEEFTGY